MTTPTLGPLQDDRLANEGDLSRLLTLAGPVILGELGWMSMGLVDTLMVGPLGPVAIGAVGLGSHLFFAIAVFGMGLLLGLDTLVSQAYGAGRAAECRTWLRHGLVLAALLVPALLILVFAGIQALPLLRLHPDVLAVARPYVHVVLGRKDDEVVKAMGAFGGGLGGNGEVCGAVAGALAVIGLRFSRAREEEKEDPRCGPTPRKSFSDSGRS